MEPREPIMKSKEQEDKELFEELYNDFYKKSSEAKKSAKIADEKSGTDLLSQLEMIDLIPGIHDVASGIGEINEEILRDFETINKKLALIKNALDYDEYKLAWKEIGEIGKSSQVVHGFELGEFGAADQVRDQKDESKEISDAETESIKKELHIGENGVWRCADNFDIDNIANAIPVSFGPKITNEQKHYDYIVKSFDPKSRLVVVDVTNGDVSFEGSFGLETWRDSFVNTEGGYNFVKIETDELVKDTEENEKDVEKTEEEQKRGAVKKAQELIDFIDENAKYIDQIGHEGTRNWIQKTVRKSAEKLVQLASKKDFKQISEWYGKNNRTTKPLCTRVHRFEME